MTAERRTGIFRLLACVAIVAVIWLGVLPKVAKQDRVKQRIQWLEEHRIDPAAMFYTDLPVMDEILKKREQRITQLDSSELAHYHFQP